MSVLTSRCDARDTPPDTPTAALIATAVLMSLFHGPAFPASFDDGNPAADQRALVFVGNGVLYAQAGPVEEADPDDASIPERDKRMIRQYFERDPIDSVGSSALPPGWRQQARPGQVLSIAVSAHAQPLPADLTLALGQSTEGVAYMRIENMVLRVATSDQRVLDTFEL